MNSSFARVLARGALLCALPLLASSFLRAQVIYQVQLDTRALLGHPAGPFSLDFQLNDGTGGGEGNNTATLSGFTFGGGNVVGAATTSGGAMGDLSSTVTLNDSSAFNEFFQSFTAGTFLTFNLSLTNNAEAPVPDLFSFSLLDSTLSNLPTLAPGSDALVIVNLTGRNLEFETYAGNRALAPEAGGPPIGLPAPSVIPVPEPSTYGLGAALLAGWVFVHRRRRRPTLREGVERNEKVEN